MCYSKNKLLNFFLYLVLISAIVIIPTIINDKLRIYDEEASQTISFYYWPRVDKKIFCHGSVKGDALQSVEDKSFNPKPKSIFFHETSCRGGVDSRQACAVESAARANPDWEVYLLFNAPVSEGMLKRSCLVKLLQYPNIKVARIHAASFSKDTVVHKIVTKELPYSRHPVEHSADIMKMLTLNKWGGVYLDLDVLVVKSFDSLPQNWIAQGTLYDIASGVMRFSKDEVGQNVTSEVLKEISETYNNWLMNGASAIRRVLLRRCGSVVKHTGDCKGVDILSKDQFYPAILSSPQFVTEAFNSTSWFNITDAMEDYYTFHVWSRVTNMYIVHQLSAYAKMAATVCPEIYHAYGDIFGI